MAYEIEDGVPIPKKNVGGERKEDSFAGMLRALQPTQSVFVPGKKITSVGRYFNVVGKQTGYKFTSRTVEGGVRVWRVK